MASKIGKSGTNGVKGAQQPLTNAPHIPERRASEDGFATKAPTMLPQPPAAPPDPNAPVYRATQMNSNTAVTMQAASPPSSLAEPQEPLARQTLDKTTDVLGLQGFAADASALSLATRKITSHLPKWLHVGMGVMLGKDRLKAVGTVGKSIHFVAQASKWMPIISIPFAGYDVYKAVKEKTPSKRPLAWANAAFTVGGTAVGTAALLMAKRGLLTQATPLFGLSAVLGIGQLVDAYVFDSKAQSWVGNTVKSLWKRLTG